MILKELQRIKANHSMIPPPLTFPGSTSVCPNPANSEENKLPHVEDEDASIGTLSTQRNGTCTTLAFLARPLEFDNKTALLSMGFITNALAGLTIMVAM